MPIITTYVCNFCGKQDASPQAQRQFSALSLTYEQKDKAGYTSRVACPAMLLCTECMDKTGLQRPKDSLAPPPPSMEDLMHEIACEAARQVRAEEG